MKRLTRRPIKYQQRREIVSIKLKRFIVMRSIYFNYRLASDTTKE